MIRNMNYELFMGEALAEARLAAARGAPPVGAIAVMNEAMVARGANRVAETNDPTAHAVIAAIREAARKLGTTHLTDVTIFTTHEPCPMCVGALLESDVAALVFAVPNPVDGAAGSVLQLAQHPSLERRLQVVSGIRRDEAEELESGPVVVAPAPDAALRPGEPPFAILSRGEVSEWLMVPLSKSGLRKQRGFESHPLRHPNRITARRDLAPGRIVSRGEVA